MRAVINGKKVILIKKSNEVYAAKVTYCTTHYCSYHGDSVAIDIRFCYYGYQC